MPTFFPAIIFVPRWRTIIAPTLACAPSDNLIPRYWGFESPRLLTVPADFVVAMVYLDYVESITKRLVDIKRKLSYWPQDIVVAIIICLVGVSSFALGWLAKSTQKVTPIRFGEIQLPQTQPAALGVTRDDSVIGESGAILVGSVNSDKYHYRWCPGAQRITVENKIFFNSKEEAAQSGYTPAQNCPGLSE